MVCKYWINLLNSSAVYYLPLPLEPYHEELQEIEASQLYIAGDPETVAKELRINFQTYMYKPEDVDKLNLYKSKQAALNGFKVYEILRDEVFYEAL